MQKWQTFWYPLRKEFQTRRIIIRNLFLSVEMSLMLYLLPSSNSTLFCRLEIPRGIKPSVLIVCMYTFTYLNFLLSSTLCILFIASTLPTHNNSAMAAPMCHMTNKILGIKITLLYSIVTSKVSHRDAVR